MQRRLRFAQWFNGKVAFYGWTMLGVGLLAMLATGPGQSYTLGLFFGPLTRELGLSGTLIAGVYGLGTGVAALGLSYTGRLVDRHGPRRMLAGLVFGFGAVCLLFPLVGHVVALFFAFAAVRFLGQPRCPWPPPTWSRSGSCAGAASRSAWHRWALRWAWRPIRPWCSA